MMMKRKQKNEDIVLSSNILIKNNSGNSLKVLMVTDNVKYQIQAPRQLIPNKGKKNMTIPHNFSRLVISKY